MLKKVALSLFLALVCAIPVSAYDDISSNDPDIEAINYMEALGIFDGSTFDGDRILTKGQFIILMLDKTGFDPDAVDNGPFFEDVNFDLAPYVEYLRQFGIIRYVPGAPEFRPDTEISFRKALELLMKFEGIPVPRLYDQDAFRSKVINVGRDAFYAPNFARAVDLNLVKVKNKRVSPFGTVTRRDFAHMIYNSDLFKQKLNDAAGQTTSIVIPKVIVTNVTTSDLEREEKFAILEDVFERVKEDFYANDDIDTDELIYGAIEGLIEELGDPYTTFSEPTDQQVITQLNNEIEGIGASVAKNDEGHLVIIAPLHNSPAEKAGLLPGDVIEKINGQSPIGLTLTEAVNKIKGKAGTTVNLSIRRNGALTDYSVVRAKINIESVELSMSGDIAILAVRNFGSRTAADFTAAVEQLDSSLSGVIVDLRSNPGGFLDASVSMAGHFVEKGKTVLKLDYTDRRPVSEVSGGPASLSGIPTIVLIDKGSASAAEILAAALRDSAGATLIGETSFGKGTVQEVISYKDNSSLKITIAHWLTPLGVDIDEVGLIPSIEIIASPADRVAGNDPALNRAIQELE